MSMRRRLADPVIAATVAALLTVALTAGLLRHARETALAVVAFVLVALLVAARHRLPHVKLESVLVGAVSLLPLAAIVGPAAALPGFPQFFAFRLLVAAVIVVSIVWALTSGRRLLLAPRWPVLLFAAWFAWLALAMLWAPSKPDGFRYLGLIALESVLMATTAAAGVSRRRLRFVAVSLGVGYGLAMLIAVAEALTGLHLQSSAAAHGGRQHIVTGFLYNPNDLATFIAVAWPFLFLGLLLARRWWQVLLSLLGMGVGLYALLNTGSRVNMLAIGLATVAALLVVVRLRWIRHRGPAIALSVALIVAFAAVALNNSDTAVLRQLRFTTLTENAENGGSSAGTRVALARAGLTASSRYLYLGVGPGNAEDQVKRQADAPENVANLHDWWFEVFVNGGLPATVVYVLLYAVLVGGALRAAARATNRTLRFLAGATAAALVGYAVGCLGPSTVVSFAPMWILFGLALAVMIRAQREPDEARAAAGEAGRPASPAAARVRPAAGGPRPSGAGEASL